MERPHIVLIEDNIGDVYLVKLALSEEGIDHELTRFETGRDAADLLCGPDRDTVLKPDLILMDLNTPRSDGFEVLGRLTTSPHLAGVPIALLTSSRARADKNRAELHGVRYLEKPSQLGDFISTVGQAVREMLLARETSSASCNR